MQEVEKGFLLLPVRKPTVADDDGKTGCESGNDAIVADCDTNKGTHMRQRGVLHRYGGGLHPRSNSWKIRIMGREQELCHVEEVSSGDMLICDITDLRKVSAACWVSSAEVDRVEGFRAVDFPFVHHLAELVPSAM